MAVYFDTSIKGHPKGGVYARQKRHNCWRAEIQINGVRIRLGRFVHEEDARKAYNLAKLQYGRL